MINFIKHWLWFNKFEAIKNENFWLDKDDIEYLSKLDNKHKFVKVLWKIRAEIITTSLTDVSEFSMTRRKHWIECLNYIEKSLLKHVKDTKNYLKP